jgi:hypothetical protein
MMYQMDELEELIRTRVCMECIDRTGMGICGMGRVDECPLNRFMPQIVKAVKSVQTEKMDDYVIALHTELCGRPKEVPASISTLAEEVEMVLDHHLPMLFDAIEEVHAKRAKRASSR